MIVNEDRKTTPKQRIIIISIALFMLLSTFALYAGIVLSYSNSETQASIESEKQNRFSELYSEFQQRKNDRDKELSAKYFDQFKEYRSRVKSFNAADVTELKTKDLVVGTGAEVAYEHDGDNNVLSYSTDYASYYIGWLSDETVFDSSLDIWDNPTGLKSPLIGSTSMIQGWLEGLEGMRIGGVREITIPSVLGYGSQAQGQIPADSPLKFIVMLIEKPAPLEVSDELEDLALELYGTSLRESQ